jgi:tRNA dimethylallyltransferase
MTNERSPVLIAGPTASGKSALALQIAAEHRGVIINADSLQVYAGLRILTARPDRSDETRAPHRLYGHVPPTSAYSVAQWLKDVTAELEVARRDDRRPIIVGGTGLYFKALVEGLSPIPDIPADVRQHWRSAAQKLDGIVLHRELTKRDPQMAARLPASDIQRVTRALEVIDGTGRSLGDWQKVPGTPVLDGEAAERIVVRPSREVLHERSDRRFDAMMDEGALDEVAALERTHPDPSLPALQALGYRALADHIAGKITRAEAVEQAKRATRQYIKRQETWINRHMIAWKTYKT